MKYVLINKLTNEIAQKFSNFAPTLSESDLNEFALIEVDDSLNLDCVEASKENEVYIVSENQDKKNALIKDTNIFNKLKNMDIGKRLIALVSVQNEAKNLTSEQIVSFFSDQEIQAIRAALYDGALSTAKLLIQNFNTQESVFTDNDKNELILELEKFGI